MFSIFVELGKDLVSNLSILFDAALDIPLGRVVTLMTHVVFDYQVIHRGVMAMTTHGGSESIEGEVGTILKLSAGETR